MIRSITFFVNDEEYMKDQPNLELVLDYRHDQQYLPRRAWVIGYITHLEKPVRSFDGSRCSWVGTVTLPESMIGNESLRQRLYEMVKGAVQDLACEFWGEAEWKDLSPARQAPFIISFRNGKVYPGLHVTGEGKFSCTDNSDPGG